MMDKQSALTLWNESRWLVHGVINGDECVNSLTAFGAVANHCTGSDNYLTAGITEACKEKCAKAATFLREWADAISPTAAVKPMLTQDVSTGIWGVSLDGSPNPDLDNYIGCDNYESACRLSRFLGGNLDNG